MENEKLAPRRELMRPSNLWRIIYSNQGSTLEELVVITTGKYIEHFSDYLEEPGPERIIGADLNVLKIAGMAFESDGRFYPTAVSKKIGLNDINW